MRNLFAIFKCIIVLTAMISPLSSIFAQDAEATINDVTLRHNVTRSGTITQNMWNGFTWVAVPQTVTRNGMEIHVDFDVSECRAQEIWVAAFIFDEEGNAFPNSGQYKTPDGQLSVQDKTYPSYTNANYSDFVLFLPYSEIHSNKSKIDLYVNVAIIKNGIVLDSYDRVFFTLNKN